MIIVAARRPFESGPGLAAVSRFVRSDVGDENRFGILRMNLDLGEIGAAPPEPRVAADPAPTLSLVIRTIDAAQLRVGVYSRVKNFRIAARDVEADAPKAMLKCVQSICQFLPGVAAVGRFE